MPDTERLYYADPYLVAFASRVSAVRLSGERAVVALDCSAFYPTGGGQPHDTGVLMSASGWSAAVVDVFTEDGTTWHALDGQLSSLAVGTEVTGTINWDRRFDHMQQHSGQHILSQAFLQTCGAETVAFHLGAAASTIDLDRVDLAPAALAATEAAANAVVDRDLAVTASYVEPEALGRLPLRKPPQVHEDIRIVQVAGFDWSACGGTHVANTGQVGLIKITGTERRGAELRVTFLCGRRARADYARLQTLAQGLVARLTTSQDELLDAVDRRAADMQALRKELADLEGQWVQATAAALWSEARPSPAGRVVAAVLSCPADRLRKVAQALRERPDAIVLLAAQGERPQLVFARAEGVPVDAAALLRAAVAAGGGRGGGRPDWAQGGVPADENAAAALAAALQELG